MLEQVKVALRINHNVLDEDIMQTIEASRSDAIRSGVPSTVMADESNPLVATLIKTYCLYTYAEKDNAQRYFDSYQYQLDNLRKSYGYVEEVK